MNKLILLLLIIYFSGCTSNNEEAILKGYFEGCNNATVEELVANYFGDPEWESFTGDDGKYHLNVSGELSLDENPVKGVLQFEMLKGNSWKVNAFELNGEPQNEDEINDLVDAMCDEFDS
jgi:hypothetical protein